MASVLAVWRLSALSVCEYHQGHNHIFAVADTSNYLLPPTRANAKYISLLAWARRGLPRADTSQSVRHGHEENDEIVNIIFREKAMWSYTIR